MSQNSLTLPHLVWLEAIKQEMTDSFGAEEERMRLVIELARRNVREGTGGPFAAAIFDMNTGALLAAGVNMVVSAGCSVLHAEVVAIMEAQRICRTHDLSSEGLPPYELVTSTEPCAMCLGAITWSGIRKLVCGARGEDAEQVGFDEGEKPAAWKNGFERRGIQVIQDVLRQEACTVLTEYRDIGGLIYNPQGNSSR